MGVAIGVAVARYQRVAGALGSDLGAETVVLNFDDGVYYSVHGPVGALLWRLLENPVTEDELVSAVTAEFDVPAARARADLAAFLKQMTEAGLVRTA